MPLNLLGLGDSFDRWWTGGGGIYYHSTQKNNLFELTFDQFTGYERQYFELSAIGNGCAGLQHFLRYKA